MIHPAQIVDVAPSVLASVTERVAWPQLSRKVPELLGIVWDFLKTSRATKAGHNVAVYRDPNKADVEVECGVQVTGSFVDSGRVRRSAAPAGRAIHIAYFGPYSGLGEAHDAVLAYAQAHALEKAEHWEVYGDWEEDPAKLRTDVFARLVSKG